MFRKRFGTTRVQFPKTARDRPRHTLTFWKRGGKRFQNSVGIEGVELERRAYGEIHVAPLEDTYRAPPRRRCRRDWVDREHRDREEQPADHPPHRSVW